MSNREGNLEAPTRHALDWRSPDFYDEQACSVELGRVFDICHGCRRCVSLCNAFPTLFDLIDQSETGELDAVDKSKYANVVDQCYLCDLCYVTKCPYVPPHPWNLDFPHTMLRAKAIKFKHGGVKFGEKFLASTDVHGQFAGIPIVVQAINATNKTRIARAAMERTLGVHPQAWMPALASKRFRWSARKRGAASVATDGQLTPGKVAIFATCYVNYNEPGIGHDLVRVLDHNDIPYVIVEKESCCGMPKLELGDLDGVAKHKASNIPALAKYAAQGYAILSAIPSCTLMFKQELPLMFPDDAQTQAVQRAMFDPFEYLVARHKDGLLKTDFKTSLGKVSYHIPCHSRVQKIGRKTQDMFNLIGASVDVCLNTVERCSGHAGTYGVKKASHPVAIKIGGPVFESMAQGEPDFVSSDCTLAGHHIEQGMRQRGTLGKALFQHPLSLLRLAYGL